MSHPLKPFQKPALSPSDLLTHLEQRGLGIPDRPAALFALNKIGYYRLLIYMRPLQDPSKEFKTGVVFGDIVDLYDFDRQLRLLCLDAIERIEVALRAAIINEVGVVYGPHFYLERRHFEELKAFNMFMEQVATAKYLAI